MASAPHPLFPHLPPELRNEVYSYLSAPSQTAQASTEGLPLKLKTYICKHTVVQICPVHHGSLGLLSLSSFQEASEYNSWLLNNALELKIGVKFRGRVNTFVQADWDKKMKQHLAKLAKLHPWLSKVARYDVQVVWAPMDGVLKSKKNKKTAGSIWREMVSTMTCLLDGAARKKKSELDVKIRITHTVALDMVVSRTQFGFQELFGADMGVFKRLKLDVWKERYVRKVELETTGSIVPVLAETEDESLLVTEKGLLKWADDWDLLLLKKKQVVGTKVTIARDDIVEFDERWDHVTSMILMECFEQQGPLHR